jgi:tetratricopeptide (TPR) repeat protein
LRLRDRDNLPLTATATAPRETTMRRHPTRDLLREVLTQKLGDDALDDVQDHLEQGCVTCLLTLRELVAQSEPDLLGDLGRFVDPDLPGDERDEGYERAVRQTAVRALVLEAERRLGPTLLAELDRRPPALRREAIRRTPRYQLFGLAEVLSEESRRAGFRDVARAVELGELSVEVADALDPSFYLPAVVCDRQAQSRAFLGNARRVAFDLFGAERAFQDALCHLERGTGDELVHGDVLSLLGSLRIDQTRHAEARRFLQEALGYFRQTGQQHDEGKVLLKIAHTYGDAGEPEKAVEILEEATSVVDADGDERLGLLVRHGMTVWLLESGQPLEALTRFEKARGLYDRFRDDPWFQLRRTWQEARIHAALGDPDRAEPLFEEARQAAGERELPYELAMIDLELAALHLDRGDTARVRQLAEQMVSVFRSGALHAHALAAVYLFQHAALTETATAGLAREVLAYLRRAQNNPYLPFR